MALIIEMVKKMLRWNEPIPPPLFKSVDDKTKEIIQTALRNNQHPSMFLHHLNYGVGYDLRYEGVLRRHLKTMKIEEVAEYCDLVMRTIGDDIEFAPKYASTFGDLHANEQIKRTFDRNFTSLANFAWLALHAPDETDRNSYRNFIVSYLEQQKSMSPTLNP
jgi:hypothetical protein